MIDMIEVMIDMIEVMIDMIEVVIDMNIVMHHVIIDQEEEDPESIL
jgi:hypothetical protein